MTTNRIVRSAAAGAALLGGVAGLPWLLVSYIGSPIPATMPSPAWFAWWLRSGQFDDHAAVVILGYVLWACWAIFTMQVAAQLPGALRAADAMRSGGQVEAGRSRSLIGGGAVQVLLTALLVTVLVPRGAFAAASGPGGGASSDVRPASVGTLVPGEESAVDESSAEHVHVVERGDTLWDIAAQYLGDPNRWPEVYQYNVGVPQPDGLVLTNPDIILPGWKLTLPKLVATAVAPTHIPRVTSQVGMTEGRDLVSAPELPVVSSVQQRATTEANHVVPRAVVEAPRTAPRDRVAVSLGADGYVGIGLAAGIAAALTAGRLRRRARGRAQFPISLDDDVADCPTGVSADLERAHLLTLAPPDHGYVQDEDDPYLAEWAVAEPLQPVDRSLDGFGLPVLKAAAEQEVTRNRKALEAPTELAWGTNTHTGTKAFVAGEAAVDGLALEGAGADAALRALIVAASAAEGVPDCGTATRVVTTSAVIERVFGTGDLSGAPRISTVPNLSDALDQVEDEIGARRGKLRQLGLRNAADVRRFKPDHLMQPLLLITLPPAPSDDVRLTEVIEAGNGLDIHAMVLGPLAGVPSVHVAADGETRAGQGESASGLNGTYAFNMSVKAAEEALGILTDAVPVAEEAAEPAVSEAVVPGQRTATPTHVAEPLGQPEPPVRIEVFDGLGVVVHGCDISGRFRPRLRTLLAYLGVHPSGAPREYLLQEVFALEVTTKTRHKFSTELSEIRRALRAEAPELADAAFIDDDPRTERLRFEPATITTDLSMFTRLLAAANTATPDQQIDYLTEAIRLYRGPVLPIIDTDWVEPIREQQRRRALDAYHQLAHLVEASDPGYAVHLLENAIDVDRYNIETYQRLMRAQAAKGDTTAVRRTFELLGVHMEDLDESVDGESQDLFDSLVAGAGLIR